MSQEKEMPEWLEKNLKAVEETSKAYQLGFRKCYQLMSEQQKPRPIETYDYINCPEVLVKDGTWIQSAYVDGCRWAMLHKHTTPTHWLPLPELPESEG